MINPRKTLFISDLHLDENHPETTRQFLHLLQGLGPSVDAVYILGDLFEMWIGDDDDSPLPQEIIAGIKSATQKGVPVYFIHGNRDFLIGKKFLRKAGCMLLPDETKINLYGADVLLMHGDTLCTQDVAYLKSRKIMRNRFLHTILFLSLPLQYRRKMAAKMRAASMRHTQSAPHEIMDVTPAEVERIMQKHQVKFLIHGHTHRRAMHQFSLNGSDHTRIVLGAWHEHGNMLVWDERGVKNLIDI